MNSSSGFSTIRFLSIISLLVTFTTIFYWEHIIGTKFFPFDSKDLIYPFSVFVSQSYRNGEIPLWNPYIYSGTPSFADPLYLTFYPGTFVAFLSVYLTQHWFDLIEIVHIFLGGLFLFLLLRDFNISILNSLIGSAVFMFSGPFVGRIQHVPQIFSASLMPLILFLVYRGIMNRNYILLGLAGVVLGSAVIVGYQVPILFSLFVIIPFFISIYTSQREKSLHYFLEVLRYLFFVLIVAVGFSAIQVIPSLEFSLLSNRPKFSLLDASKASMNPLMFFIMIFPNIFGSLERTLIYYTGPFDITESYLYVGAVPVFFTFTSLLNYKKLTAYHKFFLWVALMGSLYALGKFTPLFPFLYNLLPFLHLFKRPSDSLFIYHIGFAISVAFGIDFISKSLSQRKLMIKFLILFMIFYVAIINWGNLFAHEFGRGDGWYFIPNLIFLGLFVGLTIVVLFRESRFFSTQKIYSFILFILIFGDLLITNSGRVFNSTEFEFIAIDKHSIYSCDDLVILLKEGLEENKFRYESIRAGSISSNSSAIWEMPSSVGYSPLIVGRYDEFSKPNGTRAFRDFSGFIRGLDSRLYDLLGVKYIYSTLELNEIDPHVDIKSGKFEKVSSSCFNVYKNNKALPIVYMVHKAIIANAKSVEEYLMNPEFNPAEFVVLETLPQPLIDSKIQNDFVIIDEQKYYKIETVERKNNSITFNVFSEGNGILVYNDVFYPGWRVFVDGLESEVLRTNYTFKGVYVSQGEHQIKFVFIPFPFYLGLGITLITTIAGIIYVTYKNYSHRG